MSVLPQECDANPQELSPTPARSPRYCTESPEAPPEATSRLPCAHRPRRLTHIRTPAYSGLQNPSSRLPQAAQSVTKPLRSLRSPHSITKGISECEDLEQRWRGNFLDPCPLSNFSTFFFPHV